MTLDERVERAKRLLAEKQAQKAKEADEVSMIFFETDLLCCRLVIYICSTYSDSHGAVHTKQPPFFIFFEGCKNWPLLQKYAT